MDGGVLLQLVAPRFSISPSHPSSQREVLWFEVKCIALLRRTEACVPPSLLWPMQKGKTRQNQTNGKQQDAVTFISVQNFGSSALQVHRCSVMRQCDSVQEFSQSRTALDCQHWYALSSLQYIFICVGDFHTFHLEKIFS